MDRRLARIEKRPRKVVRRLAWTEKGTWKVVRRLAWTEKGTWKVVRRLACIERMPWKVARRLAAKIGRTCRRKLARRVLGSRDWPEMSTEARQNGRIKDI